MVLAKNDACAKSFTKSDLAANNSVMPVALRLHDQTRVLMSNTHFVGCVVQKSKGAVAYLVYRASSFMPELPKTSASDRVAWSLAEVYARLAAAFPLFCFHFKIKQARCSGAKQTPPACPTF